MKRAQTFGRWLAAVAMCAAATAQAQLARIELHSLETRTPTDQEFLLGSSSARVDRIAAELRIPRPGVDRLPAVVLLHGSGGVGPLEDQWAREFAELGYAVLLVDSFTGRRIVHTRDDQDQLSRMAGVVDAYRGLELLSNHPRIDANRVVLMGFSRGGGATHWSAIKRFRTLWGPKAPMNFAAFIAMYPTCNRRFIDGDDVLDRPVRIFHGAADDYIPVAECRAYADRQAKAGRDVQLREFAGAHHVFDNKMLPASVKLAQAQTTRNCPLIEEKPDGRLYDSGTGKVFSYATDPCVERGTTVGYDATAHAQTQAAIRALLSDVFKAGQK
jgi:dienelactone hydrolase